MNICVLSPPFTFEAMLEAVLHYDKELLQRWVVRVQGSSEAQSRLNQTFNAKLGHVQQVGTLHCHGVSQGCREKATQTLSDVQKNGLHKAMSNKQE